MWLRAPAPATASPELTLPATGRVARACRSAMRGSSARPETNKRRRAGFRTQPLARDNARLSLHYACRMKLNSAPDHGALDSFPWYRSLAERIHDSAKNPSRKSISLKNSLITDRTRYRNHTRKNPGHPSLKADRSRGDQFCAITAQRK